MDDKEDWYFTFGSGQPNRNCFIVFNGTYGEARTKMVERFGQIWSMQYSKEDWYDELSGLPQDEVYGLTQIY